MPKSSEELKPISLLLPFSIPPKGVEILVLYRYLAMASDSQKGRFSNRRTGGQAIGLGSGLVEEGHI